MEGLTPGNVPVQIANVHTIFNVVTTFLLLPFGAQLVRLTYVFLPDLPQEPAPSVVRHLDFNIFNQEYHVGLTTMMGAGRQIGSSPPRRASNTTETTRTGSPTHTILP